MRTLMIVDDDRKILDSCRRIFVKERYRCMTFTSPTRALSQLSRLNPAVVLSDQYMHQMFGTVFLKRVKERLPESVGVIMTGHTDIDAVVSAITKGDIFTFIKKPWKDQELKSVIKQAFENYSKLSRVNGEKGYGRKQ